ncbi:DUF3575 domain-containing protein [Chryseobacterium sp.]|uniref:DUF3575 domain-containing protein n=1 Tax=Chryseobacterium sp. TaxID=1871047 RepID=UPI0011CBEC49|nr:DUF3575 domain-containing protein [Chryseobacterium sp.]TXF79080.1 DUF3575 domain-containing protein [Chryseobacterium sp.]
MKKLLLVGALALFGAVNAQENSIKVNPAALLGGSDLITFEHKLGDNFSGVIGAGYGGFKFGSNKYTTYGGGLQGRYYFDEAMTGFYGAAVADYTAGKVKIENSFSFSMDPSMPTETQSAEADISAIGGGLRAGYQWIFDSGITLDINLGASYKSFKYKWNNAADETFYGDNLKASGVLPTGSLGIGYSF